jgi:hypothetical protein
MIFHLPHIHIKGVRVRARCRLISWHGFHVVKDSFIEGFVVRIWLGFFLITAMIDQEGT